MQKLAVVLALVALPALARADARADVQASLEGVVAAGGFRAYVEGHAFGPDVPAVSGEVDVIFPNRIHARTDTIEFVVTPSGAWVSLLGVWTPADRSMIPVTAFDPKAMRIALDAREKWTLSLTPEEIARFTEAYYREDLQQCAELTGDRQFLKYLEPVEWGETATLSHPSLLQDLHGMELAGSNLRFE